MGNRIVQKKILQQAYLKLDYTVCESVLNTTITRPPRRPELWGTTAIISDNKFKGKIRQILSAEYEYVSPIIENKWEYFDSYH